ncbi:lipopolysaccharide assembly protein LapA domain-containing protein [Geodermatophilus chilensis]|uniref:lipopolysaccharide assembly protein LapA domain-containing protein n=1 Tax=Geodermatophilus chilensis TaxID=2035835 RepID=UPI000C263C00|nr:lipopolysaccharide assembly protein LapA domain-containing protein [Geodermatophilus chilensis]
MTAPGPDPLRAPTGTPGTTAGPAAPGPAPADRTTSERSPARTIGRTLALSLLLFVTVVLVLFVVYNNQTVEISLVFVDVRAPLVLALVIAAALGGLLVGLAGLVLRARRRS